MECASADGMILFWPVCCTESSWASPGWKQNSIISRASQTETAWRSSQEGTNSPKCELTLKMGEELGGCCHQCRTFCRIQHVCLRSTAAFWSRCLWSGRGTAEGPFPNVSRTWGHLRGKGILANCVCSMSDKSMKPPQEHSLHITVFFNTTRFCRPVIEILDHSLDLYLKIWSLFSWQSLLAGCECGGGTLFLFSSFCINFRF